MSLSNLHEFSIYHLGDTYEAQRFIKTMAIGQGFNPQESEEFAIVASELATNLIKHAQGGQLIICPLEDNGRLGIKIETLDDGSGIADVEQAITDGFSATGSLGYGLGTINRLMDQFDIQARPDGKAGTKITCIRWRREPIQITKTCPVSFGVATRAYRNLQFNGDAFVIKRWNEFALIALIDGLGHGQYAHIAAQTARDYIENHYVQPLDALFRGSGRACRSTRGVVMALARFDWQEGTINLNFASVGNITARVFGSLNPKSFLTHRGIVGLNAPHPVVSAYNWHSEFCLILHTDGLSTDWHWNDFPNLAVESATRVAQHLLLKLANGNDDATIIVVKGDPR
ncbi:anti-sigma regulatory factor [Desulfotomaculum sp. 1211_IL3151]|uniref:anti-sigma regulatory factor n=1 Tax=Desulfotomaculum sp. 1211_IL3151 TaxID=3084055 RepID=UPI002FD9F5DF